MKLGPASARLRNRATLRAGLALVFALQIVGLCFCVPAAVDEHDCCPPTNEADFGSGLNVANLSAQTSTDCCPDGSGMRAVLRTSDRDATTTQGRQAAVLHAWFVQSNVPTPTHDTGSAPVGRVPSGRRSPILRI